MKKKTLKENSKSYYNEVDYYEEFSKYEDYPRKIEKFLLPKIKGKIVLDLGCGSGKFLKSLAPSSKKYYGLDVSKQQLKIAMEKAKKMSNVKFFNSSAENIPLPDKSIDVVIATWVISAVNGFKRKRKMLDEVNRVLKNNCKVYLVENDFKGEFEEIRKHPKRVEKYNKWLLKQGFKKIKYVQTYFKFPSFQIAVRVFDQIWGKRVSSQIKSNIVKHKAIIFEKTK